MTEPTTVAAATCSLASGGVTVACLSAMGINPTDMIAGLMGCVAVQTLMHASSPRDFRQIVTITLGGMALASILTPLAAPWFVSQFTNWAPSVPGASLRAAMAGLIAGFAQKILIIVSRRFEVAEKKVAKEAQDA